jgi:dCMP deaminase
MYPKNYTIGFDDIKNGKSDVFIFQEYILNKSETEYITHPDFYIVSKSKIDDLIERNMLPLKDIESDKPYYLFKLEYIKRNCIKLSDFSDLDKVRKYFEISQNSFNKFDRAYITIAKEMSDLSYGRRAKVGALITKDNRIISAGYNGTPPGFDNNLEIENEDGTLTTKPEVIHAEMNAICYAAKTCIELDGATMYLTLSPCHECAKLIIQSGIKRVVYISEYRDTAGLEILRKAGVVCEKFS